MDWEAFYNAFRQPGFIAGFEIENRLGGGAFGDVYRAKKTSIGKSYAIKFLKVENDDQREAVQRELGQIRHFAAIDHPNLVSIEDMGVVMDVPYIVMGYAGDDTLARRFKQRDLGTEEALRIFTQSARGVLALHDRSLVHFDLKPSNVFLRGDSTRVGDYGLSKLLDSGRLTLSYGRGTPLYMAPEILRQRADHRADIYSLGVILFESLAGELPYKPAESGGLVLRETDDPPVFPPNFPALARPVCEVCLRLSPDDRPTGVDEILAMLGQSARPGDSVVFDFADMPSAGVARSADPLPDPPPGPPPSTRHTGEGRAKPESAPPRARDERTAKRSPLLEGAVPVVGTAGGSEHDEASAHPTPGHRAMGLVAELRAAKEAESRRERGTDLPGPKLTVIPVPPQVKGGLGSTLLETTRVGFDVFWASIFAVLTGVFGSFSWVNDRLVRSDSGGLIARAARFALFLLLMAGLGFGATLLGMVGLFVIGGSPESQ